MRKNYLLALMLSAAFLIYSCSGYRYPNYGGVSHKTAYKTMHRPMAARSIDNELYQGVEYLKKHRCRKAMTSFSNVRPDSFYKSYWLSIAEAQCRQYSYAIKKLKKISNETQDNIWSARIYASLGFFLLLSHKSGVKDYLDISLAYNMSNKLAYMLEFGKYKSYNSLPMQEKNSAENELFNTILSWYKR